MVKCSRALLKLCDADVGGASVVALLLLAAVNDKVVVDEMAFAAVVAGEEGSRRSCGSLRGGA